MLIALAQPVEEMRLTLKNGQADLLVKLARDLKLNGVQSLRVNDDESVTARGTRTGLDEFKDVVRLLDVAPRTVAIQARVLRIDPSTPTAEPKVVIDTRIVTRNNVSAQICLGYGDIWTLGLTPHLNGDGSFTLNGSLKRLRELDGGKRQEQWAAFTRRVKPDTARRINLLADSRSLLKPEPTLDEFPKTPYFAIEFTASEVAAPEQQTARIGGAVR